MESIGVRGCALALGFAVAGLIGGDEAVAAQCGKAAWFDLDGITASGERADSSAMTAAHRDLPFQTRVRVENLANGKSVIVRVNDRGPYTKGRVIDVSKAAAAKLDMIRSGTARVRVTVVEGRQNVSLSGTCGPDAPAAPEIRQASLEVDLPEPRVRPESEIAAVTPDEAPAALVDDDALVVLTPESIDALPDRFADAFAPQKAELTLVAPLLEKAESTPLAPPIDPHHGVAPREDWDYLQQVPE